MDTSALTIRALTDGDLASYSSMLAKTFLNDYRPEWLEYARTLFEPGRLHGAFDGEQIVGSGQLLRRSITLPGLRVTPFAGVSAVGVAADHRRRGALNMIMRTQLHGLHEAREEPFATLWASESRIYGRYGYGLATQFCEIDLIKGAQLRPDVQRSSDPIRELPREQAVPLLEAIYQKVAPTRIGWLSRSAAFWMHVLFDDETEREGMNALRFAVHPEGYALFRTRGGRGDRGPDGKMKIVEVVAGTPQAYASLWHYLLNMDLVASIEARVGIDDALVHMLAEPMNAIRKHRPAQWVRIVDLDRALPTRRYSSPVDLVLEIGDELCPWNAGRWRLHVDAGGHAEVRATDAAPDIATDVRELGAVFLGGTRLSTLAAAGRVRELTGGAINKASTAFLGEHEPETIEVF